MLSISSKQCSINQILEKYMNVHGIHDRNRQTDTNRRMRRQQTQPQNQQNRQGNFFQRSLVTTEQNILYAQQHKVLLVSGGKILKHPSQQNYCNMLVDTFCPNFSCLSLTMFLILANIALFSAQIALGINKNGSLLQIGYDSLYKLGANQVNAVSSGQIYRLVSAIFLHIDFIHLISNIFSIFILVTRVQYTYGLIKTFIIYLLSGIGGNIFSLVTTSDSNRFQLKAGASTSLFGMIGLILGYLIYNWRGLNNIGFQLKCKLVCYVMFLLIFVLFFTPSNGQSIDFFGHLGGFLTGIWMPAIEKPLNDGQYQLTLRILFICFFLIQFAVTFIVFFTSA